MTSPHNPDDLRPRSITDRWEDAQAHVELDELPEAFLDAQATAPHHEQMRTPGGDPPATS